MKFTSDAEKLWCNNYSDLTESQPGLIGTILGRAEAQVIRLSMIYALIDLSELIHSIHLESALAVWRYSASMANIIFSNRIEDATASRIIKALQTGPKSKSELFNLFHKRITKNKLDYSIQDLISNGKIIQKKVPTKRRPKTVFEIQDKPISQSK